MTQSELEPVRRPDSAGSLALPCGVFSATEDEDRFAEDQTCAGHAPDMVRLADGGDAVPPLRTIRCVGIIPRAVRRVVFSHAIIRCVSGSMDLVIKTAIRL